MELELVLLVTLLLQPVQLVLEQSIALQVMEC